jgi:hypothetical protein
VLRFQTRFSVKRIAITICRKEQEGEKKNKKNDDFRTLTSEDGESVLLPLQIRHFGRFFWGVLSQNCEELLLASTCLSVRPSP